MISFTEFGENLWLDIRGKDIKFKSTDDVGKYKEKVAYWKQCIVAMVALALAVSIINPLLCLIPLAVAVRKAHLLYTKKEPQQLELPLNHS